ncbi:uncharacterized protein LOC130654689 [Hydractinia symbiolongicarpus]|uniref:uncharacterized protein LOC130654689 n=1 Tax=Hydractinia symbiolongicarpus TaxID=13093 RepID=UPI00254A45C4|nr:uncharacterized protein LOC130654689 [Hydractinia symbiolongicarpus]
MGFLNYSVFIFCLVTLSYVVESRPGKSTKYGRVGRSEEESDDELKAQNRFWGCIGEFNNCLVDASRSISSALKACHLYYTSCVDLSGYISESPADILANAATSNEGNNV